MCLTEHCRGGAAATARPNLNTYAGVKAKVGYMAHLPVRISELLPEMPLTANDDNSADYSLLRLHPVAVELAVSNAAAP